MYYKYNIYIYILHYFGQKNKLMRTMINGFPNMKSELSAHRWVTWSKTLAGQTVNFDSGESLTALFVQPVSSWTMMRWKTKRPTRQTKMEWSSFGEKPLKKHESLKRAFTRAFSRMQVVCFMLLCLHYGPGSVRRVGWMGRMFAEQAECSTMRVIWFLLELMLVCSHHKVGNFISDPRVHSKIWLDVSYAPLGLGLTWFSCASMSIYLQCWVGSFVTSSPLGPFYKLGVFLVFTTPWGWVSNVFSLALCQSVYVAKWET